MYMSAVVVYLCVRWCVRARCVQHCSRSLLMSLWCCKPRSCDSEVGDQLHDQLPHDQLSHDQLPHRLLNPAEYESLLQK